MTAQSRLDKRLLALRDTDGVEGCLGHRKSSEKFAPVHGDVADTQSKGAENVAIAALLTTCSDPRTPTIDDNGPARRSFEPMLPLDETPR